MNNDKHAFRASRAIRFALAAALALAGLPLMAQSRASQNASLDSTGARDYDFLRLRDARLFPETDILANPAMLATLPSALFIAYTDSGFSRYADTLIRADDSTGLKNGSKATVDSSLASELELLTLRPLQNKSACAFYGMGDLALGSTTVTKSNYDAISEASVQTDEDNSGDFALGGMYAAKAKYFNWGVGGDFAMAIAPHSFRKTVDSSTGVAQTIAGDAIRANDRTRTAVKINSGFAVPLSRSATLTIGLKVGGSLMDKSAVYRTQDSNSDGVNDPAPVTMQSYWLWYVPAVPADKVTAYDYSDKTMGVTARFAPGLWIALSDSVMLFTSIDWDAIDSTLGSQYEHRTFAGSAADYVDHSLKNVSIDSGLLSGSAAVGVSISKSGASTLRLGLGYERLDRRMSQKGVDAAGNDIFTRTLNEHHYPEANLGLAPGNGAVASAAGTPWTSVSDAVSLLGAWEYRPTKELSLFADFDVSGAYRVNTFNVFNLDTRTVWTENDSSLGIDWSLETTAGLSFDVGRDRRFIFDCRVAPLSGAASRSAESLPFDTDMNTDSSNGVYDIEETAPLSLRLRAGFNFGY
jgi:hypothetical protein